jgi:hypothetical protein
MFYATRDLKQVVDGVSFLMLQILQKYIQIQSHKQLQIELV